MSEWGLGEWTAFTVGTPVLCVLAWGLCKEAINLLRSLSGKDRRW